jgi:hypothetical protein
MKKKAKPTRRTLPTPTAPPGPVILDLTAAVGVGHSGLRTDAQSFDALVRNPDAWLRKSAELFRASMAVLRQWAIDQAAFEAAVARAEQAAADSLDICSFAYVGHQAMFLGALGAENAIKAVIVARRDPATFPPGVVMTQVPTALGRHNLEQLAAMARGVGQNAGETEVLRHGEMVISWLGRYPVDVAGEVMPTMHQFHPQRFVGACGQIWQRCLEAVADRTQRNSGQLVAEYAQLAGGIRWMLADEIVG